jgi:hypothetical protein
MPPLRGCFRTSYSASDKIIERGIEVLRKLA